MYARMIQLTAKPGRGQELVDIMIQRPLSVLEQQPGFVEGIALNPETEPDQFIGLSIWKSKADADRFAEGPGQQQLASYKPLLQGEPMFRSFQLAASTVQNTHARGAAASG
jgi:heme-degrading monooxygenase HmoA